VDGRSEYKNVQRNTRRWVVVEGCGKSIHRACKCLRNKGYMEGGRGGGHAVIHAIHVEPLFTGLTFHHEGSVVPSTTSAIHLLFGENFFFFSADCLRTRQLLGCTKQIEMEMKMECTKKGKNTTEVQTMRCQMRVCCAGKFVLVQSRRNYHTGGAGPENTNRGESG
jgi:hypothetical protein